MYSIKVFSDLDEGPVLTSVFQYREWYEKLQAFGATAQIYAKVWKRLSLETFRCTGQ